LKIAFAGVVVFMLADMRSSIKGNESGTGLFKSAHAQKTQTVKVAFCTSRKDGYLIREDFSEKDSTISCASNDSAIDGRGFTPAQLYELGWRVAHLSTAAVPRSTGDIRIYNNYIFEK